MDLWCYYNFIGLLLLSSVARATWRDKILPKKPSDDVQSNEITLTTQEIIWENSNPDFSLAPITNRPIYDKYPKNLSCLTLFVSDEEAVDLIRNPDRINIIKSAWTQMLNHIKSVVWLEINGHLPAELLQLLQQFDEKKRKTVERITFVNYSGKVNRCTWSPGDLFPNVKEVGLPTDCTGLQLEACKTKGVTWLR